MAERKKNIVVRQLNESPAEPPLHASNSNGVLCCYVDGSFNDKISNYGYGLLCVYNGAIVHYAGGIGKNEAATSMRQIAGELLGAMHGLQFARRNGYSNVVIFHDYVGVAYHATGFWKRKQAFSVLYYDWMQNFFKENPSIKVDFQKVEAHTGHLYNELADVLAKRAIGLSPDAPWLKKAMEAGIIQD